MCQASRRKHLGPAFSWAGTAWGEAGRRLAFLRAKGRGGGPGEAAGRRQSRGARARGAGSGDGHRLTLCSLTRQALCLDGDAAMNEADQSGPCPPSAPRLWGACRPVVSGGSDSSGRLQRQLRGEVSPSLSRRRSGAGTQPSPGRG